MFDNKQLKDLSHVCAYCGKALKDEDKTLDHLIPKSAGGKRYTNNVVVCCKKCNTQKANLDIHTYLNQNENVAENFKNYLDLVDFQRGNTNYSNAVIDKIYNSSYIKQFKNSKKIRLNEIQHIEYNILQAETNFKLNGTESKILDYYLKRPNFNNYKKLAKILEISVEELKMHMVHINCLTGIFVLKKVSENGIILNPLYARKFKIHKL